jgi:hypothetical protein
MAFLKIEIEKTKNGSTAAEFRKRSDENIFPPAL